MKKLVVLLMALLVASSAFAIIDPDTDMMGVYGDMEADMPCVAATPFAQVPMYLVLTNPSFDAIYGFEAGLTVVGNAVYIGTAFANPEALNVGDPQNMIVGFGSPTMTSDVTLLATCTVFNTDAAGGAIELHLAGSNPSSIDPLYPVVLLADGELMSYGLSAENGFVAQINGAECGVVATDNVSFDSVKSLYR